MAVLGSIAAIARGALLALRDPRRLATLGRPSEADRQATFEREVSSLLGSVPRSVAIEQLLGIAGDALSVFTFLDDTSTVLDLLVLRSLVHRYRATTMLEIGTFRGESAHAVAEAGTTVVTLSLSDTALTERGAPPSWVEAHRTISSGHARITHLSGDSRDFDTKPFDRWADILFIDGDHSRAGVETDTRRFWHVRSPRVGAVVWHDAFLTPLLPRWEVIAGIAAAVPSEHRRQLVHVSNTLCLAWLPDGEALPTVERSYVPRTAFSVRVAPVVGWKSVKGSASAAADVARVEGAPSDLRSIARR